MDASPSTADRGTVLVTGGNSGIGFECARELVRRGRRVAIASRDRAASRAAAERIRQETGATLEALDLDLGSFASVRQLAKEIEARDEPLQALVCNAGLQMTRLLHSADGVEVTLAVNHLGHFLLVNCLLRRLLASAPSRVVVVASGVHDPALRTGMPKPDVADFDALFASGGPRADDFDGRLAYVNSKLCNLWFTYELIRRIEAAGLSSDTAPLSVNAFEPGLVPGSGLARDYPPALRWIWDHAGPPLASVASRLVAGINTQDTAGAALAGVVLDPALERRSGSYFPSHSRFREARSSDASYDEARAAALWESSARLCGLTPEDSPLAG